MGRKAKKCPKNCERHLFNLKPVHYSAYFSRESTLNFCPDNIQSQSTFPKFNRDRKHYTSSFILARDQMKHIVNNDAYKIEHQRFKSQHLEQKTQILMPKPKQKNSFCNVCRQIYEDYHKHIMSIQHKYIIKNNPFTNDLAQLCNKFKQDVNKLQEEVNQIDSDKNLLKRFFSVNSQTIGIENYCVFNNQISMPQFLFPPTRSTKQSLQALNPNICRDNKSFHNFGENNQTLKFQNHCQNYFEHNFLQQSIFKQINQNCCFGNLGCLKVPDQTASPIKSKFGKPIILTNTSFKLSE